MLSFCIVRFVVSLARSRTSLKQYCRNIRCFAAERELICTWIERAVTKAPKKGASREEITVDIADEPVDTSSRAKRARTQHPARNIGLNSSVKFDLYLPESTGQAKRWITRKSVQDDTVDGPVVKRSFKDVQQAHAIKR